MAERRFYGTKQLVDAAIDGMDKVEVLDGGWSIKYREPNTGRYWLLYNADDRAYVPHLMSIDPTLTTDELIDIAVTTEFPDEAIAAAARLLMEERSEKKEFRRELVDKISQLDLERLDRAGKEKITAVILAADLTHKLNRREVVGKHYTEVLKDAEYFRSIARQALEIIAKIG